MSRSTRTVLRILAVANVVFFVVGLVFAVPAYLQQYRILRDWPSADATVVRSQVVPLETTSGQKLYDSAVEFAYQVNGRTYLGVVTSPHQSTSYDRKQKQAERSVPGSHHEIRYNPTHPSDIRSQVGFNVHYFAVPVFITGVAAIFGVIASLFFSLSRIGRRDEADA